MKTVAVVVGSVREGSLNQQLGRALAKLAAGKLAFRFLKIDDLPMYNDDLWKNPPEAVTRFKRELEAADAALLLTPEYNRSTSPLLKNAIDWGSRPYGKSSWMHKPTAIAGASPGAIGTAAGQAHVRTAASAAGALLMSQPELYFSARPGLIDADDAITDEGTRKFLQGYVDALAAHIDRLVR
ncbi:NADPH-dependent FMN reductase [Camelimonas lactis]|uniref:Chromate reductase n=1 Tax=Camelimonas lactis TaxID=659006 RepID=A0A4V2RXW4_9HYPH|nr:NAD(P)H-dependent oxidoreductase [Camelimonas lactis]TCO15968.1 chromate reductase [Camelimonas lactis]